MESPPQSHDDPVDRLLAGCLERPSDEWAVALDEACSGTPEHAAALRERFYELESLGLLQTLVDDAAGALSAGAAFGEFVLGPQLGSGAMGVVHRAYQTSLGRDVALKLIRPEYALFPSARARFEREAEAAARLGHPSIAQIHGAGELDGVAYFAMEWVDGEDAASALERIHGRAPESLVGADLAPPFASLDWVAAVVLVGRQLCAALEHAHNRAVLHRDVKPSNILLDRTMARAVLVDFGLHTLTADEGPARGRLTRSGATPGTLLYMAPEQLEHGRADERSEVYSLAATLYELLALQPPFQGSSRSATERLIRAGAPDSLRARNRLVGVDLESVLLKGLDADPARRYASMAAFERDLASAAEGRPVAARRAGPLHRMRRFVRREPRLAAALTLAAALGVATPSVLWVRERAHTRKLGVALDDERSAREAAMDLAVFTVDVLDASDVNRSTDVQGALALLEGSEERIERYLAGRPDFAGIMSTALARMHLSLGLHDGAERILRRALARLETAPAPSNADEARLRGIASTQARTRLCSLLEVAERWDELRVERLRLRDDLVALHGTERWPVAQCDADVAYDRDRELGPPAGQAEALERLAALDVVFERVRTLQATNDPPADALDRAHMLARHGSLILDRLRVVQLQQRGALAARALGLGVEALDLFRAAGHGATLHYAAAAQMAGLAARFAGDLDEAERHYTEASEIFESRLPPEDFRRGLALANLAGLCEARKDYERAAEVNARALERLAASLGPEHTSTVTVEGNLLGGLFKLQRYEGLAARFGALIERQERAFGPTSRALAVSHERRALLLVRENHAEEASADLTRAVEIYRSLEGAEGDSVKRVASLLQQVAATLPP